MNPYSSPPWKQQLSYDKMNTIKARRKWKYEATPEDIQKFATEQKTQIEQHLQEYKKEAYDHVLTGDAHSFITEMSFIQDILETYDPEYVISVLKENITKDEKTAQTITKIESMHGIHQQIVLYLHELRSSSDESEYNWARLRNQATTPTNHPSPTYQETNIKQEVEKYKQAAYNHIRTGNAHSFTTEMSFIQDILDTYDPEIVTRVLNEMIQADQKTKQEIRNRASDNNIYHKIVLYLHELRSSADESEYDWATRRDEEETGPYFPYPTVPTQINERTFTDYIQQLYTRAKHTNTYFIIRSSDVQTFVKILTYSTKSSLLKNINMVRPERLKNNIKTTNLCDFPMDYINNINKSKQNFNLNEKDTESIIQVFDNDTLLYIHTILDNYLNENARS